MINKIEEIINQLKTLTLIEGSELVKRIEETFGVNAFSPTEVVGVSLDNNITEEKEEKTQFNLILEEVPADKKISILKAVRKLTGIGLKEVKELVESAPKQIQEGLNKENAELAKKQIEEAGGKVSLQ
jgi:large subunit ribosomal protein L7/L12